MDWMGCLNEEGWVVFRAVGPFLQTVCGNLWAAQRRHTPLFFTHIYYKPPDTDYCLMVDWEDEGGCVGGGGWEKEDGRIPKIYKCINTYFPNTKISTQKSMLILWSEYVESEAQQGNTRSLTPWQWILNTYTILYIFLTQTFEDRPCLGDGFVFYQSVCLTEGVWKS